MNKSESCESADSSSESESTPKHLETRKPLSRSAPRRAGGASAQSSAEKAEADGGRGRRGTGGGVGLSTEELQELHKLDPKRAKRILANRSSAARSKVRKLRYISELEDKSAALQENASSLISEIEKYHDRTLSLSKQNEELFGQAYDLQDQRHSQEVEAERLIQQYKQLQSRPKYGQTIRPPEPIRSPFLDSPLSVVGNLQDVQEDQLPSLQFPCRRTGPQYMQQIPSLASMFQTPSHIAPAAGFGPSNAVPDLGMQQARLNPHGAENSLANATLSGGSGLSYTTQESRVGSEMDPALMELLSLNQELEPAPKPFLPPLGVFGHTDDRAASLGARLHSALPSLDSSGSRTDSLHGLRGLHTPHNLILEAGRHRSVSSGTSSYSNFVSGGLTAPGPHSLDQLHDYREQGLARWPRHFSDPQAFPGGRYSMPNN